MDRIKRAKDVLETEIDGLRRVQSLIGGAFEAAVDLILERLAGGGKVVITGVGKNLHIAQKIAATLSSTGTPSVLLHPGEAMHGDLGILDGRDVLLALSYSGATEELMAMRTGDRLAQVAPGARVKDAVLAMTSSKAGAVAIVHPDGQLAGIFTDGDLRRHLSDTERITDVIIDEVMTREPITLNADDLAVDILQVYETHSIDDLVVVDADGRVVGQVDIQDLPKFKVL